MLLLIFAITGLCIGSFINVVIYRLPIMLLREQQPERFAELPADFSLARPRSHCPYCRCALGPLQLIPVVSWLWLRGRCPHCKVGIALRYPLVELLHGGLFTLIAWQWPSPVTTLALCLFASLLLALAVIDYQHMLLPDALTLPLVWSGLLLNATPFGLVSLHSALYGAVSGYLSLWMLQILYRWLKKQEGMGGGDLKLFAALGAWLGVESVNGVALIASLLMLVAFLAISNPKKNRLLPFGPALIAGAGIWLMSLTPALQPLFTGWLYTLTPSFTLITPLP
ncbi:prepilin peptidase [Enterobacteriaceae bacterium H20N1]|uniref:Prepilin leader peptidase/N-methyltransferase n=1 Tax=Dryocola boscaweniae TaxID=2925397 RepID=A0A9X2W5C9_9ENTR|nr:A24 family peptidase [Dryocola boscaweniae]MCT4700497.1 prepilin peptidase [Dryocola boscaweniae]MCT4717653.1 prepilin peptidase [Dryocola boscaweniae]